MFIIAQIPFADFRSLHFTGRGRLARPDWSADTPQGFIRGFGNVSPRNSSGLELSGERSFANFENAASFRGRIEYRTPDGQSIFCPVIWFRRLYFDGHMAGRFEFGFNVFSRLTDPIDDFINQTPLMVDPAIVATHVLNAKVEVKSLDGSSETVPFNQCARPLALAYLTATTSNKEAFEFPVSETMDEYFHVGEPLLHIRIGNRRKLSASKDRTLIDGDEENGLFISSSGGQNIRNNLLVQSALREARDEAVEERVNRVLFSHLNSLIFAYDKLRASKSIIEAKHSRSVLREAVQKMLERLANFQNLEKAEKDFSDGLAVFSKAHGGRIDQLVDKLTELAKDWDKKTFTEYAMDYIKGVHDLTIKTTVETTVNIAAKGSL